MLTYTRQILKNFARLKTVQAAPHGKEFWRSGSELTGQGSDNLAVGTKLL